MNYKYKDYVSVTDVVGNDKYRFLLQAEFNDRPSNRKAVVIMQNPSKADKTISDQTVNRVLEVMHDSCFGICVLVNLIPMYGTNSSSIADSASEDDVYSLNDIYIKNQLETADSIFVAWGGCNGFDSDFYSKRVFEIKRILNGRKAYCYKLNQNGTPIHPSRNQWKKGITEKDFNEYIFK